MKINVFCVVFLLALTSCAQGSGGIQGSGGDGGSAGTGSAGTGSAGTGGAGTGGAGTGSAASTGAGSGGAGQGGAASTSAGSGGAGQGGASNGCMPGYVDCDGYAMNGCESVAADCPFVVVLSGQLSANSITADDDTLYWTNGGTSEAAADGSVMAMPMLGGAPTVLASGQILPKGIERDSTHVYWITENSIKKVPLAGGPVTTLVSGSNIKRISVSASSVCFLDGKSLYQVPLGGGNATLLGLDQGGQTPIDDIVCSDTDLYWFVDGPNNNCYNMIQTPLNGGGSQYWGAFCSTYFYPDSRLTIDAQNVFMAGYGDVFFEGIWRWNLTPKPSQTKLHASDASLVGAIASDPTHVYWTQRPDGGYDTPGSLHKVPRNGGASTKMLVKQAWMIDMVLGPTDVYWIESGSEIFKMAK